MKSFTKKKWLLSCVALFGATFGGSRLAKADSLDYLNFMLSHQPDVTVDPYVPEVSASQISFNNLVNSPSGTPEDETVIDIMNGADASSPYFDSLAIIINPNGGNPNGSLSQFVDLGNPSDDLMFSSSSLIAFGDSSQTGSAMIPYWFLFRQTTSTFYAPAGALVGGLVTNSTGTALSNGASVNSDIKEYVFAAAPLPAALPSALVLMSGLVGFECYRRMRARVA